jgi:uncharacterized protein YqjF (DUF2071 family)
LVRIQIHLGIPGGRRDDGPQTRWLGADSILFATAHRPWPPPMTPWVMTQRWNDLLFLHYSISPDVLRPLVPSLLNLDTHDDRAWVSITPFVLDQLRPHGGLSLPVISRFPELNLRTYVTYEGKPGVFFFNLDAGNLPAVWGARIFYRLPYWKASMKVKGRGSERIEYASKREHGPKPAVFRASYGPAGDVFHATPGSIQHFLIERYCLYAFNRGRLYRADIHHLPWQLQEADCEIGENSMAAVAGIALPPQPTLVNFARELKVLVWAPERLL